MPEKSSGALESSSFYLMAFCQFFFNDIQLHSNHLYKIALLISRCVAPCTLNINNMKTVIGKKSGDLKVHLHLGDTKRNM